MKVLHRVLVRAVVLGLLLVMRVPASTLLLGYLHLGLLPLQKLHERTNCGCLILTHWDPLRNLRPLQQTIEQLEELVVVRLLLKQILSLLVSGVEVRVDVSQLDALGK